MNTKEKKFRVVSDNILVLPEQVKTVTAAGIHLPPSAIEKPYCGEIIEVGPGNSKITIDVEPGQKIMYPKRAGSNVLIGDKTYRLIRYTDILFKN